MRIASIATFLLACGAAWADNYGKLPLGFEANAGQTARQVTFLSRGHGVTIFLTSTGAVLRSGRDVTRMQLERANPSPRVSGLDELPGKSNYLIGNDPALWRTNVATYAKVRYDNVYPGVDLIFYGNQQDLEYDFVVAPGADPRAIRFSLAGRGKLPMDGAALAPGFAGLYQVAIQVPASLSAGNWPVVASIGAVSSPNGIVLAVQN